ncbi:hypothetical protein PO80_19465 [Vibrio parahaemolyticus]|nr:hypothetical protein [Vibrio parahaemolyticus]KHF13151.1 hypothetical protein PO80_19465 [Vibrio parahaemolyticus]OTV94152.1 hypothetical protein BA739_24445 [Vibrio parahaemolyticus]OTV98997.1 hypothetical protein BA740_24470 [Vibrio parahaemolyticus]
MDYHVELEGHYYSVPYRLLRELLEAHISGELVTLDHNGQLVSSHPRKRQFGYSTLEKHMPENHRQYALEAAASSIWLLFFLLEYETQFIFSPKPPTSVGGYHPLRLCL